MHAAGVVIAREAAVGVRAVLCRGQNGEIVTQFAKDEVEQAGLVKFDFLGLKTLTVIDIAVKLDQPRSREPQSFDIDAHPARRQPTSTS